jgi:hypothetical protein
LKEENIKRERKKQGKFELWVQTNASWATSDSKIKEVLFDLASFGVKGLDIASHDNFHFEQGIKKENLENLEEIANSSGLFDEVSLRGAKAKYIMPVGRGKNINPYPKFRWSNLDSSDPCRNFIEDYNITIRLNGDLYTGCSAFKIQGNILEQPLTEIFKNLRKDERMMSLNKGGITKLARVDGWKRKDLKKAIEKYDKCGFCFREYLKDMWDNNSLK